jgi:hypothetical protein
MIRLISITALLVVAALGGVALAVRSATAGDGPPPTELVYLEAERMLPALESYASNADGSETQAVARRQGNCCSVVFSGQAQVQFRNFTPGNRFTLRFEVPEGAEYALSAVFTTAPDYGIYELFVDGRRIGERFDGYSAAVARSQPVSLGRLALAEGSHTLTVTVPDKNAASTGFHAGVDYLELRTP